MKHKRNHTGENPFECEVYNWTFSDKIILLNINVLPKEEKPFESEILTKVTLLNINVFTQEKTGEKPFESEVCN
ncbi:UNVERIFIED_CONTAM: zinc finger protein 66 [Trichonephila clavipes]